MSERGSFQAADFTQSCGALLSKIPGVFSANVSEDEQGEIAEIHILASTRRNAKQISRDVQSAIAAAFHREVDHRTISIAQIDANAYGGVDDQKMRQETRLRYVGMNVSMHAGKRVYQVRLMREDREYIGEASCPNSPHQKRRAVAESTICALESALSLEGALSLVAVHNVEVAGIPIILCAIECTETRDGRLLIGAAHYMRDDDEAECVVRATLDGLNRFCGRLAVRD